MTLPEERMRAIKMAEQVLIAAANGEMRGLELRYAVRSVLRHYPTESDLRHMAERCPEYLSEK